MKQQLRAGLAASLLTLCAASAAFAADSTPPAQSAPAQTSEQKPAETTPPKKTEPSSTGSSAKQAGKDTANGFKKFGNDVGDFFDGLFNSDKK